MHSRRTQAGRIELAEGSHKVRLEYVEAGAGSELTWSWARDGGSFRPVPSWVLSGRRVRHRTALAARAVEWGIRGCAIFSWSEGSGTTSEVHAGKTWHGGWRRAAAVRRCSTRCWRSSATASPSGRRMACGSTSTGCRGSTSSARLHASTCLASWAWRCLPGLASTGSRVACGTRGGRFSPPRSGSCWSWSPPRCRCRLDRSSSRFRRSTAGFAAARGRSWLPKCLWGTSTTTGSSTGGRLSSCSTRSHTGRRRSTGTTDGEPATTSCSIGTCRRFRRRWFSRGCPISA